MQPDQLLRDAAHYVILWLQAAAPFLLAVLLILLCVWALRALQRRAFSTRSQRADEHAYLKAVIQFVQELHVHTSFDERFFVAREFRLRDRYQPRSFFLSTQRALLSQLQMAGMTTLAPENNSPGYYTRNLAREALSSSAGGPLIVLGEPGCGKSVTARQLTIQVARDLLRTQDPDGRLPVLLSLRDYSEVDDHGAPVPFYDFLSQALRDRRLRSSMPSSFLAERLDQLLDSGRLLLILEPRQQNLWVNSGSGRCPS